MNPSKIIILLAMVALLASARAPDRAATQPKSPVRYRHIERIDPPMHVHVITIDLTDPRVRVRVCSGGDDPDGASGPWETVLAPTHDIAERNGLTCAVNANYFGAKEARQLGNKKIPYFAGNPARVWGWAMSDGRLWGVDPGNRRSLVVNKDGRITIGQLPDGPPPADAWQIVTGSELLVIDGKVATSVHKDRAPRTAVGIDRDGRTLMLVVVDGRKLEHSIGMTSLELAQELVALGCDRALMLDGGGSSTMAMRDPIEPSVVRVMNQPSDGHDFPISLSLERAVACVIGVEVRDEAGR